MPTKAELQVEIDGLKHQVRRMNRALNQAQLDLSALPERLVSWPTPHIDPRSAEAIQRGLSEWEQNISDPDQESAHISGLRRGSDGRGRSPTHTMGSLRGVVLSLRGVGLRLRSTLGKRSFLHAIGSTLIGRRALVTSNTTR